MVDDALFRQLQTEFLDTTDDCLDQIEKAIDGVLRKGGNAKDALKEIRRQAHSIKGMSASLGYPLASMIAHRMEDYLSEETEVTSALSRVISGFTDPIREIAKAGDEPTAEKATEIVRALPARRAPPDISVTTVDIEVLLGVPSNVTAKIVRDILQNCGFRVVRASTMADCFTLGVRARPDALIFALTLDELSGADLARAFHAMPSTAHMPVAILTSFDMDHAAFKNLPDGISVVRIGKEHFDGDMADFLEKINVEK